MEPSEEVFTSFRDKRLSSTLYLDYTSPHASPYYVCSNRRMYSPPPGIRQQPKSTSHQASPRSSRVLPFRLRCACPPASLSCHCCFCCSDCTSGELGLSGPHRERTHRYGRVADAHGYKAALSLIIIMTVPSTAHPISSTYTPTLHQC